MGAGDYAAFLRWYVASRCLQRREADLSAPRQMYWTTWTLFVSCLRLFNFVAELLKFQIALCESCSDKFPQALRRH
jgi:hypothetical protein